MSEPHLEALNLVGSGEWERAHALVQQRGDGLSCLIHAYLHRVEGDLDNAAYWYRRAGTPAPNNTLEDEFRRLLDLAARE